MTAGATGPEQLMVLARQRSPEARRALLRALTRSFVLNKTPLDPASLQHFDVIMRQLASESDAAQRRELAAQLARLRHAPRGLLACLARDEIAVAEPVLRHCETLREDDLIAVVKSCASPHLTLIAHRPNLQERVANALIRRRDKPSLIALAQNQSAQLNSKAALAMTLKAQKTPALQEPLCARYDLSPQSLTHLYFIVPGPLKHSILKRCDILEPALVERAAAANRRRILSHVPGDAHGGAETARNFLSDMLSSGKLGDSLLKDLIASRKFAEFLFAFAYHAGVDISTAQTMLKDRTFESIAIAARATGLEHQTFAKIVFSMRRKAGDQSKALRILDLYTKVPEDGAERIMRFWRMRTQAADGAALNAAQLEDSVQERPVTVMQKTGDTSSA